MAQHPAITVAIPTFNRCKPVVALVESLLPQLDDDDELIVCDDGSSDGTESALRAIPRVRYLRNAVNVGMVRNWNHCLIAGRRDWLCLIHDDDRVSGAALATLRRGIAEAGRPALLGFKGVGNDVDGSFRCQLVEPGPWAVLNSAMVPSGVTLHREIVEGVGLFDDRFAYSADIEYFARVSARYRSVVIQNPTVVHYQLHDTNYQYGTWRMPDFMEQLQAIERAVVRYAGMNDEAGERAFHTRMAGHLTHMFKTARRLNDRQVMVRAARQLLDHPQYADRYVLRRARLVSMLSWLPNSAQRG